MLSSGGRRLGKYKANVANQHMPVLLVGLHASLLRLSEQGDATTPKRIGLVAIAR
ncbi:MAG: hypothetical protein WA929_11940 [Pseudomonas neustonica]